MPRFGVLSDLAVKAARPEFFPLDITINSRFPASKFTSSSPKRDKNKD
jgi:hydrogenase maturation factor